MSSYDYDYVCETQMLYDTFCPYCHKEIVVCQIEQEPGFRDVEEMRCPYCKKVITTSMTYEYVTFPKYLDFEKKER